MRLIGSVDASDYLDLIAARGREREVLSAVLDALEQADTWDALDLWNVPEASLTRALLPELIAPRGWTLRDEKQVVCPIIRLPAQFEDYVQSLDKKAPRAAPQKAPGRSDRRRRVVCHYGPGSGARSGRSRRGVHRPDDEEPLG